MTVHRCRKLSQLECTPFEYPKRRMCFGQLESEGCEVDGLVQDQGEKAVEIVGGLCSG